MLKLDPVVKRFESLKPVLLGDLGLKERTDLQECICNSPNVFFAELEEDDLLILGSEGTPSEVVGDRIDILALDRDGTSVIIELKRGTNKWHLLQALAYVALISKWGAGEEYLGNLERIGRITPARKGAVNGFIEAGTEELNGSQRVIMVAEAYDYEVLVTAQWLNETHDIDIRCYQIAVARDGSGDAQYVSCTLIYPPRELPDRAKSRRRVTSGARAVQKDWETILLRSAPDVVQFFRERLKLNPPTNIHKNALAYRQAGQSVGTWKLAEPPPEFTKSADSSAVSRTMSPSGIPTSQTQTSDTGRTEPACAFI